MNGLRSCNWETEVWESSRDRSWAVCRAEAVALLCLAELGLECLFAFWAGKCLQPLLSFVLFFLISAYQYSVHNCFGIQLPGLRSTGEETSAWTGSDGVTLQCTG